MGAEILLYGYGIVCLSMLVFNVIYGLHLKSDDKRLHKKVDIILKRVETQLSNIREGKTVENGHLKWLRGKLSKVNYLLAFDHYLNEHSCNDDAFQKYMQQIQPIFLYLATVYWKRESTQAAYYCHFLAIHRIKNNIENDQLQKVILSYIRKDNLYCRVNAFKALCSFGSPDSLIEALLELGKESGAQLHEKVITEALLTYKGDVRGLIERIWMRFDRFSLRVQRAVLDYIRFKSSEYGPQMREILYNTKMDKELRFSAIRYFGKYPDPSVKDILIDFIKDNDPARWEYAAISATSLAKYPGKDTVDALLDAMRSPNWYIRYNASASLETLGLSYEEMLGVLAGNDRYAREMLSYRLESKRLEKQGKISEKDRDAGNLSNGENGKAAVGL